MAIELTDDGTMDTVLRCSECGEEMRYNYDPDEDEDENAVEQDEDGGYWRIRYRGEMYSAGYLTEQGARNELETWLYDAWVADCIEDAASEHECTIDDDDDAGPQDEDITTEDYQRFYYCGKCIVEVSIDDDWMPAVGAWCKANGYFPNVWAISDHGNAHLISVTDDGRYLGGHSE